MTWILSSIWLPLRWRLNCVIGLEFCSPFSFGFHQNLMEVAWWKGICFYFFLVSTWTGNETSNKQSKFEMLSSSLPFPAIQIRKPFCTHIHTQLYWAWFTDKFLSMDISICVHVCWCLYIFTYIYIYIYMHICIPNSSK